MKITRKRAGKLVRLKESSKHWKPWLDYAGKQYDASHDKPIDTKARLVVFGAEDIGIIDFSKKGT